MMLTSKSPQETLDLARTIAKSLKKGSIVCLHGDLGAGKTTFVKGMVKAFGFDADRVTSPTFVLMNIYEGKLPVYHFDLYRLEKPTDMLQIGYDEFLYGEGISVIEWAERLKELYPKEYLRIELRHKATQEREIILTTSGRIYEDVIRKVGNARERSVRRKRVS